MTIKEDQEEIWNLIFSVAPLFQRRCWVCKKKVDSGKGCVIHHRNKESYQYAKSHQDFKDPNKQPIKNRLDYIRYLIPLVKKRPKLFRFLHNSCHHAASSFALWKPENRKRLSQIANEINPPKQIQPKHQSTR